MADYKYAGGFMEEVETQVAAGNWVRMCTQCGVCSGSCPLRDAWEHPPHEILTMIRANRRNEVLTSTSMWMCTSCYNCVARCPRGLPVTDIMHGLAHYAERLGVAPRDNPTRKFALKFWDNLAEAGRINELKLGLALYFMNGFGEGVKTALKMKDVGMAMARTGRLRPMEIFGGHGIEDRAGLRRILAKAREIEVADAKRARG